MAFKNNLLSIVLVAFVMNGFFGQAAAWDKNYPLPANAVGASFGSNITRTMSLLATSTPQRHNKVRILFYGQSITKQYWSDSLVSYLKRTYPNADIEWANLAIGGWCAALLVNYAEKDIAPWYPDLMIFHDYECGVSFDTWAQIISITRTKTAAEVMTLNHFIDPSGTSSGDVNWHASASTWEVNTVSPQYHTEAVDVHDEWQQYLTDNGASADQMVIPNEGHLNDWGNFLMCELVKQHFVYKSAAPSDPDGLAKTYHAGTDFSFVNKTATLRFAGNRLDIVASSASPITGAILIDGKKPSTYNLFSFTRANDYVGRNWPEDTGTFVNATWVNPPVVEDWTAVLSNFSSDGSSFNFTVSGSKTGADGAGSAGADFVSNSKRVAIKAADWWVKVYYSYTLRTLKNGYEIKWSAIPHFIDDYTPPQSIDPVRESVVTVAQGLTNADHSVEIDLSADGAAPISALRVYRPFTGRSSTTVPDPKPVSVAWHAGSIPAQASLRPEKPEFFDLHGRPLNVRTLFALRNLRSGCYCERTGESGAGVKFVTAASPDK